MDQSAKWLFCCCRELLTSILVHFDLTKIKYCECLLHLPLPMDDHCLSVTLCFTGEYLFKLIKCPCLLWIWFKNFLVVVLTTNLINAVAHMIKSRDNIPEPAVGRRCHLRLGTGAAHRGRRGGDCEIISPFSDLLHRRHTYFTVRLQVDTRWQHTSVT